MVGKQEGQQSSLWEKFDAKHTKAVEDGCAKALSV
jgi:hypothetical protein